MGNTIAKEIESLFVNGKLHLTNVQDICAKTAALRLSREDDAFSYETYLFIDGSAIEVGEAGCRVLRDFDKEDAMENMDGFSYTKELEKFGGLGVERYVLGSV